MTMGLNSFVFAATSILITAVVAPAGATKVDLSIERTYCVPGLNSDWVPKSNDDLLKEYNEKVPVVDDKLNLLFRSIVDALVPVGLYEGTVMKILTNGGCGPRAVQIEINENKSEDLKIVLRNVLGVNIYELETYQSKLKKDIPAEVVSLIEEEGNTLVAAAREELLSAKAEYELEKIESRHRQIVHDWKKKEIKVGEQTFIISQVLDPYNYEFLREIGAIKSIMTVRFRSRAQPLEEKITEMYQELGKWSNMSYQTLNELGQKSGYSNIADEISQKKAHFESMTLPQRAQATRIQLLEDGFFSVIQSLASSDNPTGETMELFAEEFNSTFLNFQNARDESGRRVFSDGEIVEVLNRNLSLWRQYPSNTPPFGPKKIQAIQLILSLQGLDPLYVAFFNALLDANKAESLAPSVDVRDAYKNMWDLIAFEKVKDGINSRRPVKHFGRLFNPTAGILTTPVNGQILFIEKWFQLHGIKTSPWSTRKGRHIEAIRMKLQEFRERLLAEDRRGPKPETQLKATAGDTCEQLLKFLAKPKK